MTGPFQSVIVLELASGIAGPYCGMLLADLGADVIKAEPPHGDHARGSPAFHVWNRGKRSVIADPQSEDGRATIRRLAKLSHTPGRLQGPSPNLGQHTDEVLAELGYDQEEIARLREGRIVA